MSARRVLVVDDSSVIRDLATLGLTMVGGCAVTAVESGAEALEHAAAAPPDAILLDVEMPGGLDGPETFARLQANPATRDIPVILVTAKDTPADRERFVGLGVAGVITKPFEVASLAGQVARLAGWSA